LPGNQQDHEEYYTEPLVRSKSVKSAKPLILVTGATGYVGGRLLRALEAAGHRLRCLARRPEFLQPRVLPSTGIVKGDVLEPESLRAALAGVHTAYYLVHSMAAGSAFAAVDRKAAEAFAAAAQRARVQRIIYLGGLGSGSHLSPHLASRQETGRILRESGVPTLEFRASIIIGSGSLSFEMIRALVEKLPIMITPRWVNSKAQPIAVEDVVAYLSSALDIPASTSQVYEIGGADQVSYMGLMREYAHQRRLRRWMVPVPVLTPWLSSLWLGLVTPVYARVGRELIEGVRNATVVQSNAALEAFSIRPRGIAESIARALRHEDHKFAQTRWSDALSSQGPSGQWGGVKFGSRLVDSRSIRVAVPPAQAFRALQRIGGDTGWYYGDWLWRLRGFLDLLVGGAGLRRGRRHPWQLAPGDTVDCWRVEAFEPGRLLRLFAEMKLPGRAWLQFEVAGDEGGSTIRQTALFDPMGAAGLLSWYGLYPLHTLVFSGMLKGIARAARAARAMPEDETGESSDKEALSLRS
jgi:uncharacterized protein YbjT (DUF2867 family)